MTKASYSARYVTERPFLDAALDHWSTDLKELAKSVDRNSFVDGRVKTHRSVLGKLYKNPASPRTWESLGDLVALKAIFPTVEGVEVFTELLLSQGGWHPDLEDRKAGVDRLEYAAKQFDMWRDDLADSQGNPVKTEVQVRTAAVDAWYVVDHRLRYKGIVPLPEKLERKVLRLTVLQELFDEEVRAISTAHASLAEYGIARAYEYLTRQIDDMTDGLATASRPEALLETLLGAYTDDEVSNLQEIVSAFLNDHNDAIAATVHGHQHDARSFVEDRDWLYSEPEALLVAERAVARPSLLKNALKGSDYERTVTPIARAFQSAIDADQSSSTVKNGQPA